MKKYNKLNNDNEVRKFPIIFMAVCGIFIRVLSILNGKSVILASIGELMIFSALILLAMAVADYFYTSLRSDDNQSSSIADESRIDHERRKQTAVKNPFDDEVSETMHDNQDTDLNETGDTDIVMNQTIAENNLDDHIDESIKSNFPAESNEDVPSGKEKKKSLFFRFINYWVLDGDSDSTAEKSGENAAEITDENAITDKPSLDTDTQQEVDETTKSVEKETTAEGAEAPEKAFAAESGKSIILEDNTDSVPDIQGDKINDEIFKIKKSAVVTQTRKHDPDKKNKKIIGFTYCLVLALAVLLYGFHTYRSFYGRATDNNKFSLLYCLVFTVVGSVSLIYLNVRKDSKKHNADSASYGLMMINAMLSFAYAVTIAVNHILEIDIMFILQIASHLVGIYIMIALILNVILSLLKNTLASNFDYIFLYNKSLRNNSALDSDAIKNNISVKSLYSIKYFVKVLPSFVFLVGIIIIAATSFYVVNPSEKAIVYRLGKTDYDAQVDEGFHVKLPWPIDKVEIYDVKSLKSLQVGYKSEDNSNFLWDQKHDGGESSLLLGNGNEAVSVNIQVIYAIDDLKLYLTTAVKPEDILSAGTYQILLKHTNNSTLDEFLTVDRKNLSDTVKDELQKYCNREGLGIAINQIVIESIHPPVDVAYIYRDVISASIEKTTAITDANSEALKILIDAERQKKTAVDYANADQLTKVSEANKEMSVYYAAMDAYKVNPKAFKLTKYLDTYEKVISGNKVYVFSPSCENEVSKYVIDKRAVYASDSSTTSSSQSSSSQSSSSSSDTSSGTSSKSSGTSSSTSSK